MSAIAGVVRLDGAPIARGIVEGMTAAMSARGPDGAGHWRGGSAALGHNMLRTTPESLAEAQPLANDDASVVLVMDGRVDNREELRAQLRGRAVLRDATDVELVLRAYEAWGDDCPDRIVGEFVFVVWDSRTRTIFGARDAVGTRHFYYHAGEAGFAFASEIRGVLASGLVEPRLNEQRLMDYLVVEFDRDDEVGTFYQEIFRLPAGHAVRAGASGVRTWRYWDPADLPESRYASMDECAEAFRTQLRIAVECRLRSNGRVGAMLSGGLDSSSIVAVIRKDLRHCLDEPLKTYSVVLEDRERCEDWKGIGHMLSGGWLEPTVMDASVARKVGLDCVDAIENLDEPFALAGAFTYTLLYEAARRDGCRVLLDGIAGDLLFHSYGRSLARPLRVARHVPAILAAGRRHRVEGGIRPVARAWIAGATPGPVRGIYRKLRPASPSIDGLELLRPCVASRFLENKMQNRALRHAAGTSEQADHARNFTSGTISFAHEMIGGSALACGVEPASPFSDRRMVEFAVAMPLEAKLFAGWYKLTLRRAMAGVLPEEVRWRTNMGPHPGWDFYRQLFAVSARAAPTFWNLPALQGRLEAWVDPHSLARAWERHSSSGDHASGLQIFSLAVLKRWLETHFDRRIALTH